MNFEVFGALVVYQNRIIVTDNRQCSAQHYRILDLNDDLNREEIQTSTTIHTGYFQQRKKSNVCFSILTPLAIYFKSAATKEIDLKNCTSGHFQ